MSIGVITLKTIPQPDNVFHAHPAFEPGLNLGAGEGGVPVFVKQAVFRGEQGIVAVRVDGASLKDIVVGLKGRFGHRAGGKGNTVVGIPRLILSSPAVETEIVGHSGRGAPLPVQHEDGTAVPEPSVVGLDGDKPEVGRLDSGFAQSLPDFVGGGTVVHTQVHTFAGDQGADDVQIGPANRLQQSGPGALVVRPGQPGCLVFFPLGGKTIPAPVDGG